MLYHYCNHHYHFIISIIILIYILYRYSYYKIIHSTEKLIASILCPPFFTYINHLLSSDGIINPNPKSSQNHNDQHYACHAFFHHHPFASQSILFLELLVSGDEAPHNQLGINRPT